MSEDDTESVWLGDLYTGERTAPELQELCRRALTQQRRAGNVPEWVTFTVQAEETGGGPVITVTIGGIPADFTDSTGTGYLSALVSRHCNAWNKITRSLYGDERQEMYHLQILVEPAPPPSLRFPGMTVTPPRVPHPAQVTSDRLGEHYTRWASLFSVAELDAIVNVQRALERLVAAELYADETITGDVDGTSSG
jgi:hypothetical protein